jgi:hypothetical protein
MAAFLDGCRFNPTAGGTNDWTYSSPVPGYQNPTAAGAVNGTLYKYRAESTDLSQWELGEGAYNTATGVLARTTVLFNSSGTGTGSGQTGAGTKISFSTVPQIAVVALAEDLPTRGNNLSDLAQKYTAKDNISIHSADIASTATLNLETATGDLVDVTGTTTISAITLSEGHERTVRFTGVLTLTNGASVVLPGGANITTQAGDFAIFRGYASGVVRCVDYVPVSGILAASGATQSEQEAGSSLVKAVVPGRQQFHPSAAKAWVAFSGSATNGAQTIFASYNVASVTRSSLGFYAIVLTTNMSSGNYAVIGSADAGGVPTLFEFSGRSASGITMIFLTVTGGGIGTCDPNAGYCVFFGDQ